MFEDMLQFPSKLLEGRSMMKFRPSSSYNRFHQYTEPLGALQHLQVYAAEPTTLCVL